MTSDSHHEGSALASTNPGCGRVYWLFLASALGITVLGLRIEGRRWWCRSSDLSLWSRGIHSGHTSQHLADPYSLTHVLHGFLLYAFLRLVAGRLRWETRLVLAVAVESVWEVVENTEAVIDRYRHATIALGYQGDSVLNSIGDIVSCGLGVVLAGRLPVRWSIALFLLIEAVLLVVYRDNLLLSMIMLVHPFEAIKSWQTGR